MSKFNFFVKKNYEKTIFDIGFNIGNPHFYSGARAFEFFSDPYYEGDGYEMQALRKDKCDYISYWEVENGIVSVKMGNSSMILSYEDSANSAIASKERENDIQDNI